MGGGGWLGEEGVMEEEVEVRSTMVILPALPKFWIHI